MNFYVILLKSLAKALESAIAGVSGKSLAKKRQFCLANYTL